MAVYDESVLHFIWKNRLIPLFNLRTQDNREVEIIHPGFQNTNSGPDFTNARIRIDGQLWAGNVELHIRASGWYHHGHQNDPAYNSVILHVVYEADRTLTSQKDPPVLELKNYIDTSILENAKYLLSSLSDIPCHNSIAKISDEIKSAMISRVAVERLEVKMKEKEKLLDSLNYDYYRFLLVEVCSSFGLTANKEPMYRLAMNAPIYKIIQTGNDRKTIEALLYGMASLLPPDPVDEYSGRLMDEFEYLKYKYQLMSAVDSHMWKFHRLQPVSFPTIRLSQLSALLMRWDEIIEAVFRNPDLSRLKSILRVEASEYWNTHFKFGVKSETRSVKRVGDDLINRILINAIIPVMVNFSKNSESPVLRHIAIEWLEQLPAENNSITRQMRKYGFKNSNALMSQGLIQLKNVYCSKKKCLFCSIGFKIIKS